MTAQVTLSVEALDHIVDVNVSSGDLHLHAKEKREDMYAAIDVVLDKLERQIQAQKGANIAKKRGAKSAAEVAMEEAGDGSE
jgi:putative sigma-54 modulation protein